MTAWPYLPNPKPYKVVRSEGCYLYLENGERILDACGGAIVTNIGHGRREIAEVVAKATLNSGYIVPPFLTPEREALVERLMRDWLPPELSHIHVTCGGSEGNDAAIKLAILYQTAVGKTDKTKILGRNISYHGTTIASLAAGSHASRKRGLEHKLDSHNDIEAPYLLRCESADPARYYFEQFKSVVEQENPDTVAAILFEPITGASGGALVPPDGYLTEVATFCKQHDILIICDEVMTGYGRTGTRWGYQHWDFVPDIMIGGKGLAGGYAPITGVFSSHEIAQALAAAGFDMMFNTFSALPAACAAAEKVLQILDEEELINQVKPKGELLRSHLLGALDNHPHVAEVRGIGLLQAIEIVADRNTLERFPANKNIGAKLSKGAMDRGVSIYPGGNGVARDILVLGPPFTITESQIADIARVLSETIDDVTLNHA